MKEHAAAERARRGRSGTAAPPAARGRRKSPVDLSAPIDAGRRHRLIAEAAYYRAELRGFDAAGILEDWLAAEREVDRLLLDEPASGRAPLGRQEP